MNKSKLNIITIIFITFFLYSCESAKDALQGKKRSEQKDEFLVQKKNPLALPPDYETLPTPGNQEVLKEGDSDTSEVKDLLSIGIENNEDNNSNQSSDIESAIIEKIQ
tara:strand:- start:12167 stop:12490 length:324 start_codon:yes stop_codon:yes gene_type:complete